MKYTFIAVAFLLLSISTRAQEVAPQKLKVFIDCPNGCDYTFMRTEINLVDFFLDRIASDVHVLITQRQAGSGGAQYQMIFYGQKRYSSARDTLSMVAGPNATAFEKRDLMIHYLKMGLAPFIAKTEQASAAVINMKTKTDSTKEIPVTTDKWNYWVYRIGGDGQISYNKNYLSGYYGGFLSANRTTDKLKVSFQGNNYTNFSRTTLSAKDGGDSTYLVKNSNFSYTHQLVKTISNHWSVGYDLKYSGNSFTNYKSRLSFRPAIEYNFFKYSEVNTKFFVVNYGIEVRHNRYIDPTLYLKTEEVLYLQSLKLSASVNQKWGTLGVGVAYRNYLHDFSLNNIGINGYTEIRITGGLSYYTFVSGSIVHDQIYLPAGDASDAEVLTQKRQLASTFNVYTEFGLSYRFGSKLNNYVNPRFTGRANNMGED